jgi:FkbM family methyltransferase
MKALLLDDHYVEVSEQTALLGGSFEGAVAYAPVPLRWAYEQLKTHPAPVLIDGGASTGSYSLLASMIPALRVYAFEPVPHTYSVLVENIRLNGLSDRVSTYQVALSDKVGVDDLHVTTPPHLSALSWVGANTKPIDGGQPYLTESVPTITIDEFCRIENVAPTLIKLDLQGAELPALLGAEQAIAMAHPDLVIEYGITTAAQYGYHPDLIEEWLKDKGYTWTLVTGTDFVCRWLSFAWPNG